jgi:hypothetical protein
MAKTVNLRSIKKDAAGGVRSAMERYEKILKLEKSRKLGYWHVWWVASMTSVELHAIWERYAEARLVAALNHAPTHFLKEQDFAGMSGISKKFARYIVREGRPFFDFRSVSELKAKANRCVGISTNPFRALPQVDCSYLDCLSAIRNCVVHGSRASVASYKRQIRGVYGIKAAPETGEFLNARDTRTHSPARYESRLHGLALIVKRAIRNT